MLPQPAYESDATTKTIPVCTATIWLAYPVMVGALERYSLDVIMSVSSYQSIRGIGRFVRVYVHGPSVPKNLNDLSDLVFDINTSYVTAIQGGEQTSVDSYGEPSSINGYGVHRRVKIPVYHDESAWFDFA